MKKHLLPCLFVYLTFLFVGSYGFAGSCGGGDGDGGDGVPVQPSVFEMLTGCTALGLEDLMEFLDGFFNIAKVVDDPTKTLPSGYVYNSSNGGDFSFELDLDEDSIPEEITGMIASSYDLSNGVDPEESFIAVWTLTENAVASGEGGFSFIKLSVKRYRITIIEPEPSFSGSESCGELRCINLDIYVDPSTMGEELPYGSMGLCVSWDSNTLECFIIIAEGSNEAEVSGTYNEEPFLCTIDLVTYEISC